MNRHSDPKSAAQLVARLAGHRVVVAGDLLLDEYLVGRPSRISREAPVLVLEYSRQFWRPGGAANPACNIQALGSGAELVGAVGDDDLAERLLAELAAAKLGTERVFRRPGCSTSVKTRVLAEDASSRQHIVRFDRPGSPLDEALNPRLADVLLEAAAGADAVLLSDYRAGAVSREVVEAASSLAGSGALVTVDSQGDLEAFHGQTLLKCNVLEAERLTGARLNSDSDVESTGLRLLDRLGARYLVITRGPQGLSAFEVGRSPLHLPAENRTDVFDVTGAGDTVIAVLTLALAGGCTLAEAARLANAAAGLVVRRLGVATVSPAELATAISTD